MTSRNFYSWCCDTNSYGWPPLSACQHVISYARKIGQLFAAKREKNVISLTIKKFILKKQQPVGGWVTHERQSTYNVAHICDIPPAVITVKIKCLLLFRKQYMYSFIIKFSKCMKISDEILFIIYDISVRTSINSSNLYKNLK